MKKIIILILLASSGAIQAQTANLQAKAKLSGTCILSAGGTISMGAMSGSSSSVHESPRQDVNIKCSKGLSYWVGFSASDKTGVFGNLRGSSGNLDMITYRVSYGRFFDSGNTGAAVDFDKNNSFNSSFTGVGTGENVLSWLTVSLSNAYINGNPSNFLGVKPDNYTGSFSIILNF